MKEQAIDNKELILALEELEKEKGIKKDYLLESMEYLYSEGLLERNDIDNIKREIIKLNFGSMINIW